MTTAEMLIANKITKRENKLSLRTAATIAGISLLIMAIAAPFAELYVYPKLIVSGDAAQTVENIMANKTLFTSAIMGYLVAFVCDVLAAWSLYTLLKPVNETLSLLTAWFRLVYTVIALVALLHLVTVARLLSTPEMLTLFQPDQFSTQVMLSIQAFRSNWYFGLLFFAIHLGLLGYLVLKSEYIPKILGLFLMVAGAGYLLSNLKPFLFPSINLNFAEYTFYGELIFMLWLLIKGPRLNEPI